MQDIIVYISNFDYVILHAVQSLGPQWESVAHFISNGVGSYPVMFAAFLAALLIIGRFRISAELFVITGISFCVLMLLKYYFGIDRPYVIDPSIIFYEKESSFALPSGHALMSMVILGWVAFRHPKSHILLWGVVVFILLIGASRIYLGVHYPSQVVAGWLFGLLLLYAFRAADRLWGRSLK